MNRNQIKQEICELFEPDLSVQTVRVSKTNRGLETTVTIEKERDRLPREVRQNIISKGYSVLTERERQYVLSMTKR